MAGYRDLESDIKKLESEIKVKVTDETIRISKKLGEFLGKDDFDPTNTKKVIRAKLTTNQLRKFFGEVKRQQMKGYNPTEFVLLKPKLAYAVARAKGNDPKIKEFYEVISSAIGYVENAEQFKNFIKVFEAIVAYHKVTEEKVNLKN